MIIVKGLQFEAKKENVLHAKPWEGHFTSPETFLLYCQIQTEDGVSLIISSIEDQTKH